jgi:hypothetical protein
MIWAAARLRLTQQGEDEGRVEMHSDAGGVRRAGSRLPAGVQQNSRDVRRSLFLRYVGH